MNWNFNNMEGTFKLNNPDKTSYLYFPLANHDGMMSSISPLLGGDIKTDQNSFFLQPVSVEDLHNNRSNRNFWLNIKGTGPWSASGNSAKQISERYDEHSKEKLNVEAGLLWHKVIRENYDTGIRAEIINFVPIEDKVELMQICISNGGQKAIEFTPTAAIPIYARSADNLRDHRHVTSLLNRISTNEYGITVRPALSFDERGHQKNKTSYGVFAVGPDNKKGIGFYPVLEDFIGEGGSLDWPEAVVLDNQDFVSSGYQINGYEAMGAIRFQNVKLAAGESVSYVIMILIADAEEDMDKYINKYCSHQAFFNKLEENKKYWQEKINQIEFYTGNKSFDNWMKWVTLQPILRRIFGCSFLPHHDYGRGGRGWRDLWQDCLALLLMDDESVHDMLYNNFAGVRIDGSNATIIGNKPGEFIADRNNISRLWIDHGSWPLQTSSLYIHMTGDLDFLLEKQSYFKDSLVSFARDIDEKWNQDMGNKIRTKDGDVYQGSILEHILVENLTVFFNVGENNNIRLEDADWNDALDMASDKGESVAFTAFYAGNLLEIIDLLLKLKEEKNITHLKLFEEIRPLLDSLYTNISYDSVNAKKGILEKFFDSCKYVVSGKKLSISIDDLIRDIQAKADWMIEHLRVEEWISAGDDYQWFNGYYDNNGRRVDGSDLIETRMTLTGQVFSTMFEVATDKQVEQIAKAADKYLFDESVGGYRLNTEFKNNDIQLGRCFAFAYGHKENGAMFSHMAVMYANALYRRGFVKEGYRVWNSIYQHCLDFEKSRIYPGIPEYINQRGRGLYSYLTGSASWLLLTMVTEVFGVKGYYGDLKLQAKLLKEQFDQNGIASIGINFSGKKLKIEYCNTDLLDYGEYCVKEVCINYKPVKFDKSKNFVIISRDMISSLEKEENIIAVELG
ncbi:MAG: GH36-type glycosyl hydrolase domain-containing protein [Halanaerobiaceae bacterium]